MCTLCWRGSRVWAEKAYSCFSTSPPTVPGPFGESPPAPRFLLPSALCAGHPLPFHLDLPLLSHLVEVERKDRELKRRLSREGREGRTWTEVRGEVQPGETQKMAPQSHELHTGSGRWLRRCPQWVMGVPEGCWPGCMGSVQGNLQCSPLSLLHLPFLPLRSEFVGMFTSVFKMHWDGR